jgi:hypothetical protein
LLLLLLLLWLFCCCFCSSALFLLLYLLRKNTRGAHVLSDCAFCARTWMCACLHVRRLLRGLFFEGITCAFDASSSRSPWPASACTLTRSESGCGATSPGRRQHSNNLGKDIAHLWELGGGANLLRLMACDSFWFTCSLSYRYYACAELIGRASAVSVYREHCPNLSGIVVL